MKGRVGLGLRAGRVEQGRVGRTMSCCVLPASGVR